MNFETPKCHDKDMLAKVNKWTGEEFWVCQEFLSASILNQ